MDKVKIKVPSIFKEKMPSVKICTDGFIRNNYDKQKISAQNVNAEIRFNPNSFDSINLPEIQFSNMLPEKLMIPPRTKSAIEELKRNPGSVNINSREIDINRDYDDRMKKILTNYLSDEEFNNFTEDFRKSELKDDNIVYENHGDFRVITLYSVEKEQDIYKQYLTIILLDPHHLFIPSRHNGKTKEEAVAKKYREVKNYSYHIKQHFSL
jgi:hypothetical protein